MAAVTCSSCERPAVFICVCAFPLPLLCEGHCLNHSAESHFLLPLNALRHVQNIETQVKLNERVSKLRRLHFLIDLYKDSQQQPTIDIRELLTQFYKDVEAFKAEVTELKAESIRGKEAKNERVLESTVDVLSALIWSEACPENELVTWMTIGYGLSLKTEFQYEESCRVLEDRWKLSQSNKGVEVLVLSIILSEVMGLHIGRSEEALAVLEQSIQVANELYPKSEIALQLSNMKAAILFNFLLFEDCIDFCNKTILNFSGTSTSEFSFGTALYFYICAISLSTDIIFHLEVKAIIKEWILKTENSSNSLVEHIRLYLSASLKIFEMKYEAAEDLIKKANELARRDFPTSIYAALSWFLNFIIRDRRKKYANETDFNEGECMRVHFPASLLLTLILERKAEFYNRMRKKDKEFETRLSMHQLLQRNPNCEEFYNNVIKIKYFGYDIQPGINIYELAYRILFERSFASRMFSKFLSFICYNYQCDQLPEKAFEMYAETVQKLQAIDPTHKLLFEILKTLSEWNEDTQRKKSGQICIELYQFLRENHPSSENYRNAVIVIVKLYMNLEQYEKAEDIFVEGLQTVKTFSKFKDYIYFIRLGGGLILGHFSKEKKMTILDEIYDFLILNAGLGCFDTSEIIYNLFRGQPEKRLTLLLAVYRALLASPTDPALIENLRALSDFYCETKQFGKEIEIRLEVHQLLLDHVTCRNFLLNVRVLTDCYRNRNQIEKAIQLQVEAIQLLRAHPTSNNYEDILLSFFNFCIEEERQDIALEQYAEAYLTLQPAMNPQHSWILGLLCRLHYKVGSRDTALQIAQELLDSSDALMWDKNLFRINYFSDLYKESGQYNKMIDMLTKAITIFYENKKYLEVQYAFNSLLSGLSVSRKVCKVFQVVEKFLGIVSDLEERSTVAFQEALISLSVFLEEKCWGSEEGIAIRKKILLQVFSLRLCGFPIYEKRHRGSDERMSFFMQQLGALYWKAGEREKAEASFFRVTRVATIQNYSNCEKERYEYRSLYEGGQPLTHKFDFQELFVFNH